jgi:protein PhnA
MNCPKCSSVFAYLDLKMYICPECGHEWNETDVTSENEIALIKDSNGNILADGDDITLIKDLKLKGSSTTLKSGSKAKSIRLVDGDHEIDCKIDGMKVMLKACFVKKA